MAGTRTRVMSALVMGPTAILAILFLPTPWVALIAAVMFLGGMWEWLKLAGLKDTLGRLVLIALNLGLMVGITWASRTASGGTKVLFQLAIVAGALWWLVSMAWLSKPGFGATDAPLPRMLKLTGATLSVVPAWCALVHLHAGSSPGMALRWGLTPGHLWLLAALMTIWAADTGAYFAGRKFGRRKLSPRISPNKTVEGLIGGCVLAMVVGSLVALWAGAAPANLWRVAVVGAATVVASVIGDLFESLLKRQAGVKDSSDLIPGHGGILDRIDSVLAALPVFALAKELLGL